MASRNKISRHELSLEGENIFEMYVENAKALKKIDDGV